MRSLFEGGHYLRAGFIFFVHMAEKDGNPECFKRPPHIQVCMDSCEWRRVSVVPEDNNNHDPHAVAVMKDGQVVGHVPRELSRILYFFLKQPFSRVLCVITGRRKFGVGLEVPCIYKINGESRIIKRLKRLLKKD